MDFTSRKPLPVFVREEIVDLYNNGVGVSEISRNTRQTRVTKGALLKVVQHFALHSTTQPFSCGGSEPILITDDILEVIEIWKLWKPSLYASEIRERPLREGSCTPANVRKIFNWMIRLFETWSLSFNLVAKECQSNSFTNHSREYRNLTSPSVHAWSALTVIFFVFVYNVLSCRFLNYWRIHNPGNKNATNTMSSS